MKSTYKIWIACCMLMSMPAILSAQFINVSGAAMNIPSGTFLVNGGSVILQNSGGISNAGTILLGGDWTNNGSGLLFGSQGTVVFNGSSAQSINGSLSTSFYNLSISNSAGVSLGLNQSAGGLLNFISGKINTGAYTLHLTANPPQVITGASATSYVNGNLRYSFPAGSHIVKYEIGKEVYAPMTLTLNNVTTPGSIVAFTAAGPSPNENYPIPNASGIFQPTRVSQYWSSTNSGVVFTSASTRFDFTNTSNSGNALNYKVRKFNPPFSWTAPVSSVSGTTILASSLTSLTSEYVVGEIAAPVVNDGPANAQVVPLSGNSYPNCGVITGDVTQATSSSEDDGMFTGADTWYQFVATSSAVRITMTSSVIDCAMALYQFNGVSYTLMPTSPSGLTASENLTGVGGTEILNYDGLTTGVTYYLSAGAASAGGPLGAFSVCIQRFNPTTCANGSGTYDLCSNFKPTYSGASLYNFTFTGTGSTPVGPTSASNSVQIPLSTPGLGLRYGGTYNVSISATYNLLDALGATEVITVAAGTSCSVTIAPHPDVMVKPQQICPATILRSTLLNGKPFVCAATSFTVSFRKVNQCSMGAGYQYLAPAAFEVNTPGASAYLNLSFTSPQPLTNQTFYEVRWRPNFSYGPGTFGSPTVIFIGGPVMEGIDLNELIAQGDNGEKSDEISPVEAAIYPNPNKGDMFMLNVSRNSFDADNVDETMYVRIMDSFGRIVFTGRYIFEESLNTVVTMENELAGGIYLVEFTLGNEVLSRKMIVSK